MNELVVKHLFPILDAHLLTLLRSLSAEQWNAPTLAKHWTVKDIVAHLLDGNIRTLSLQRDRFFGVVPPKDIASYQGLVQWLNALNHEWAHAAKRISPEVLILLHEVTGTLTSAYYASLNPDDEAVFSVAWAGEDHSVNWMHLAREYTEKWHHQQQIRHAVGAEAALMTRELFFPAIDTFMRALPHTYRTVEARAGTLVCVSVSTDIGGAWWLRSNGTTWQFDWHVHGEHPPTPDATVTLPPETAWMLVTKGVSAETARSSALVTGKSQLVEPVFSMVSVMA
jgi:hypothetical protein